MNTIRYTTPHLVVVGIGEGGQPVPTLSEAGCLIGLEKQLHQLLLAAITTVSTSSSQITDGRAQLATCEHKFDHLRLPSPLAWSCNSTHLRLSA